jgi:hypothetical protein
MSNARQAAMSRAAASGRPQDANLLIAPTEAKIATGASEAIQTGLARTNADYRAGEGPLDEAELGIEDPNALDFLGQAAGAGLNYYAGDLELDRLEKMGGLSTSEFIPNAPATGVSMTPDAPQFDWGRYDPIYKDKKTQSARVSALMNRVGR